jgi:hypothetical protein
MDESKVAAVPELQTPEVSIADSFASSTSFFVPLQHVISTLNRIRGGETRESLRVLHGPLTASAGGGVQVDFMFVVGARPVQHTLVVRRVVDGEQATFACAVTPQAAGLEQGLVAACRDARSLFDAVEFCLAHLHTEQQRVSVPGLDRWDAKEFAARLSEHDLALSLLRAALVGNRTATVLRPMPAVGPAFKQSAADRRKGRDLDADLKLLVRAPYLLTSMLTVANSVRKLRSLGCQRCSPRLVAQVLTTSSRWRRPHLQLTSLLTDLVQIPALD